MAYMIQIQDHFATELASSVMARWESIQVHYENMMINGELYEIYTAFYYVEGVEHQFNLDGNCLDILFELNKHCPENQEEKWTWLEFSIDPSGKYKFDFKYDMPPLIAQERKYAQ